MEKIIEYDFVAFPKKELKNIEFKNLKFSFFETKNFLIFNKKHIKTSCKEKNNCLFLSNDYINFFADYNSIPMLDNFLINKKNTDKYLFCIEKEKNILIIEKILKNKDIDCKYLIEESHIEIDIESLMENKQQEIKNKILSNKD